MKTIDSLEQIEKHDVSKMQKLLIDFPRQIENALAIGEAIKIDRSLADKARVIVFTGLGGSAIGADVIKGYLQSEISCPILVNRSYVLPKFVGPETLLIVSSYSGNTEETIAAYGEGKKRGARIVTISSGGEIEKMAKEFGNPHIKIPSGFPPRAALGYSVIPLLLLFDKLGFIRFQKRDFEETVSILDQEKGRLMPGAVKNEAKELAALLYQKYPLFYSASDHFEAVALRWRGQMEEKAKSLATHHVLPEMNHNEIVGWHHPQEMIKDFVAVFLRDKEEHPRVQIRMKITQEIVEKKGAKVVQIWSRGKSLLARIFSLIYVGDFVSFYLAVLYEMDPTAVKVIDYLKGELAKV